VATTDIVMDTATLRNTQTRPGPEATPTTTPMPAMYSRQELASEAGGVTKNTGRRPLGLALLIAWKQSASSQSVSYCDIYYLYVVLRDLQYDKCCFLEVLWQAWLITA
jgi:hypothetical protein